MSAPKNRGQGNNQSADLTIPTLGSGPVIQPGEDPAAIASLGVDHLAPQSGTSVEDFINEASAQPAAVAAPPVQDKPAAPSGFPSAREMSSIEMAEMLQTMQQQQALMMQTIQALARNNPVFARSDRDQFAEVPLQTLEIPIDGSLDKMRRPDQRAEQVDIDVVRDLDHAAMLAFLEEYVVINIHDSSEQGVENPVVLHVNGRSCAIVRGEDTAVRRKYVELLLRAKPEAVKTRITRDGEGNTKNHVDKTRSLKYPFSIVLDRNPRGRAWAMKIRSEA